MQMDHKTVEEYILSMEGAVLEYPFGKEVAVYKVYKDIASLDAEHKQGTKTEGKMFALIAEGTDPIRLSLKCDPELAKILREKYETVMPGYHLNKKHWNTIILSGQLTWYEVQDLIRHSYILVASS